MRLAVPFILSVAAFGYYLLRPISRRLLPATLQNFSLEDKSMFLPRVHEALLIAWMTWAYSSLHSRSQIRHYRPGLDPGRAPRDHEVEALYRNWCPGTCLPFRLSRQACCYQQIRDQTQVRQESQDCRSEHRTIPQPQYGDHGRHSEEGNPSRSSGVLEI